jgi:hypothetical protein
MHERELAAVVRALQRATSAVPPDYFQLPVAGRETPVYRERVYCYELYHQLRVVLPTGFPYSLSGELDKSGHPLIRDPPLNRRKPDLLLHSPGNMDSNLVAIEIKAVNAGKKGLAKDLSTLVACLTDADYEYAILLFYGHGHQWRPKLGAVVRRDATVQRLLDRIAVYWHAQAGDAAMDVDWRDIMELQNNQMQRTRSAAAGRRGPRR